MGTRKLSESNHAVLARFEEEADSTVIPQIYGTSRNKTFFYVCNSDVIRAGSVPSAYATVKSSMGIIKLLKPFSRRWREHPRTEFALLESISGFHHPNIVQLVGLDEALENWMQLNYVGPSLQIIDRFHYTIPHAFLWSILKDVIAALAFLHWGIPATWLEGDGVRADWLPIAHGAVSACAIHLDVNIRSETGYPKAVLTDFSKAKRQTPRLGKASKNAHHWKPSKSDVSLAACVFHKIAHGLPYEARPDPRTGNFCKCLQQRNCPSWLTREIMDKELAGVLEMACNIDNEQITSSTWLGYINGPRGFSKRFPNNAPPLHERDLALLASQLPSNGEIRSVVSPLRGVYADEEDRLRGDADLMENDFSFLDEKAVSLRFKNKIPVTIVDGSMDLDVTSPSGPSSDAISESEG